MRDLPHSRRGFLKAASIGAAGIGVATLASGLTPALADTPEASEIKPQSQGPGKRRLNVVLMVADDQRHDVVAAMGNAHIQTPHLDRMVKAGFALTAARCMGSQNAAVCVPARAMLHTGRSLFHAPEKMGQFVTLGQALLAAGYQAFHAGKWHNGTPAFVRSFSGGGNIFFGGMHADQFKMPVHHFDPTGKYDAATGRIGNKFSSELFTDAAVDFITKQAEEDTKPFFCHLAFTSPHDPRTPPLPYSAMYDAAKMPLPANWLPRHPFDNGELNIRDEKLAPMPRTEADTRRQLCDYYGMVSSQDEQVGRVWTALETTGQLAHTLVIYTGDHGLSIGSHGLFGKQSVYEEAQRIPLMIHGPGIPAGASSAAIAYGFDIYPTICDLLGVPIPASVEGRSLKDVILGKSQKVRDTVFGSYIRHNNNRPAATQHTAHDTQWKMIRYDVNGAATHQLFDLANDPHESRDLSQDGIAATQLPRLQKLLTDLQKEWDEPEELRVRGRI